MIEQVLAARQTREKAAKYPGIPASADGTAMIVYVETRATQGSSAYPITSSTQMGVGFQAAVADGFKNVWDQHLQWMEMESEHSSATGCEGFALAGGRVTNFTDPDKGDSIKDCLSLAGNPSANRDWTERRAKDGTKKPVTFLDWAKTEGRFRKHFDKEGNPVTDLILQSQQERLRNWWRLQELAGIENADRKEEAEKKA